MSVVLSYVPSPEGRGALPFGLAEARLRATDLVVIAEGSSAAEQVLLDALCPVVAVKPPVQTR